MTSSKGQSNPLVLTVNNTDGVNIQAFDFQTYRDDNTAVAFIREFELNRLREILGDVEIHTLTDPDGIPYKVVDKSDYHRPGESPAQKFDLEVVNL